MEIDRDAINAFNLRCKGATSMVLSLPGICENKVASGFTDEEKQNYMYTLWSRSEKYLEKVRKENGD